MRSRGRLRGLVDPAARGIRCGRVIASAMRMANRKAMTKPTDKSMEDAMTQKSPNETEQALARRTILKAAGLGVGMLSGFASAAQAQGAAQAAAQAAPAAGG